MADGRIVIDTKLDKSGLEQGLKGLQTVLKTGLASIGVASLGKIIGSIANETKALNDSVRKASTLFGSVAVDTDKLKNKMTELAISTGSSSEEIGEALYNALSAGVESTEDMGTALSFVEKSIKTSKAGFADLASTVTATASVLNAYGMATKEADRVQGILLQTQNLGITTVAELSSTLAQVVPTASAFGVSFEQVGASLATMTAQGTKTAQATTSLNALLAELGKSGMKGAENLKKAGEYAGIGAKGFKELIDEGYTISDILQLMEKYAKDNGMTLVDMFGSIEAGKASLQLASNEGEKFNDSLAKMSDTAGLVDQGFSTVLSNADRLKNLFTELKRLIGNEMAPALDKTAGKMADFIEKIVTNKREAEKLDFAFEELSLAVEEYKTKQDEAKEATDALTLSIAEQSRQNLSYSVFENAKIYGEAIAGIKDLEEENEKLRKDTAEMWANIEQEAQKYKLSLKDIAIYATQGMYEEEGFYSDAVVAYREGTKRIVEWGKQIDENTALIEKNKSKTSDYIAQMARLVSSGALDMDLLASAGYGLADAVQKYVSHMNQASAEAEGYSSSISQLEESLALYESNLSKVAVGSAGWVKWSAYVDVYRKALEKAVKTQEFLNAGVGGGSEGPKAITDQQGSSQLNPFRYDPPVTETDEFWKVYQKLNGELNKADEMYKLLGDEYDIVGAKTSAYQSALESLASAGVDMNRASVQKLISTYAELAEEQEHLIATQKLIDTSTDIITSSFKALSDSIGNIPNRLKELDQQMAQNNDTLKKAENEKLDIEKEILDAKARGDEEAKEQAQERLEEIKDQIQGYKNLKKQIEDDKKAVESGAESWKMFGKAGLLALAEILDSLGHQLTAQAVTALLSGNIAGSILAGAGATTAYLASAGIKNKANSFAQGGIVQQQAGVSPTGDNHIAYVNAGELILNQAQQSNLADQIRAMSEGLQAGGNIVINLSGAYIYGLDEPAVGRAIHDNIERLRSEGVL